MRRGVYLLLTVHLFLFGARISTQQSIYSTLKSNSTLTYNLTYFSSSIEDAGLTTLLSDPSLNFTVFAPSDAAFTALESQLNVSGDVFFAPTTAPKWAPALKYQLISPSLQTGAIVNGSYKSAYGTTTLKISKGITGNATVNSTVFKIAGIGSDAVIVQANISAGNSTIHIVDTILLPFYTTIGSGLSRNSDLSTLNKLTTTIGNNTAFLNVLNNINTEYTVLAPMGSNWSYPDATINATLTKYLSSYVGLSYFWNYHLIPKPVVFDATKFFNATTNQTVVSVTTFSGLPLTLVKNGNVTTIVSPNGNATIVSSFNVGLTSSASSRSAIHLISQPLVPPVLNTARDVFSLRSDIGIFLSVLGNSSYARLLDNRTFTGTILAPTDTAFKTLLTLYPGYTVDQFIAGTRGIEELLNIHIFRPTITLAGLNNSVSNITITEGIVILRANKSSSSNTVKFISQGSTAGAVGADYYIGPVGSGGTFIVIDAVLLPAAFNIGSSAVRTAPTPLALLLGTVFAVLVLRMFEKQGA
ncbi:hypothetical protein Vretimale_14461 [Volvox reticuliferus]|uniref:FAS1 domain-containing protein n=1 Tax=Volvox reticuliferus TaxID=1737510 RepID=A0A8J4CP18_9CHLO|nr:hypothetical protein Vretifemale_13363 [Volvox reticuliferus]GIM10851.1 hypothetical protein Vretimale_14461 [Volvox reticuliferus]